MVYVILGCLSNLATSCIELHSQQAHVQNRAIRRPDLPDVRLLFDEGEEALGCGRSGDRLLLAVFVHACQVCTRSQAGEKLIKAPKHTMPRIHRGISGLNSSGPFPVLSLSPALFTYDALLPHAAGVRWGCSLWEGNW